MKFSAERFSAAAAGAVVSIALGCTSCSARQEQSSRQERTSTPANGELQRLVDQANQCAQRREFVLALELVDRAVALAPNDLAARRLRVHCLAGVEDFDELLLECDRAIALGRPDAWLLYERGVALETIGRYAEALEGFTRALEFDPRHYKTLEHRGCVRQILKQHATALDDFGRALELTPDAADREYLLRRRADSLEALGRRDDALRDRAAADAWTSQR